MESRCLREEGCLGRIRIRGVCPGVKVYKINYMYVFEGKKSFKLA